jgi:hypothetical protein
MVSEVLEPPAASPPPVTPAAVAAQVTEAARAAQSARKPTSDPADEAVPAAPAAPGAPEPGSEQARRQVRKAARNKRAPVPSWDEIMFGNARQRD